MNHTNCNFASEYGKRMSSSIFEYLYLPLVCKLGERYLIVEDLTIFKFLFICFIYSSEARQNTIVDFPDYQIPIT